MAVADGDTVTVVKDMGLVATVFDERTLSGLQGHLAIGHVRYSTAGGSGLRNAQPFAVEYAHGSIGVAHNGNLVNAPDLRRRLELDGSLLELTLPTGDAAEEDRDARMPRELGHLRRRHRPDAVAAIDEHELLGTGDAVPPET